MEYFGFALFLLPNGEIEVCKVLDSEGSYMTLYHKSYNAGESLKQNLLDAYDAYCEYEKEAWENGQKL